MWGGSLALGDIIAFSYLGKQISDSGRNMSTGPRLTQPVVGGEIRKEGQQICEAPARGCGSCGPPKLETVTSCRLQPVTGFTHGLGAGTGLLDTSMFNPCSAARSLRSRHVLYGWNLRTAIYLLLEVLSEESLHADQGPTRFVHRLSLITESVRHSWAPAA